MGLDWDGDPENLVDGVDLDFYGRVRRAGDALDSRLRSVAVGNSHDPPEVGDADDEGAAVGIGECAQLAPEILGEGPFKCERGALALGDEVV